MSLHVNLPPISHDSQSEIASNYTTTPYNTPTTAGTASVRLTVAVWHHRGTVDAYSPHRVRAVDNPLFISLTPVGLLRTQLGFPPLSAFWFCHVGLCTCD